MPSHSRPTEEQYPDILERAADILESEQVEWCQGRYFNISDDPTKAPISACALGAVRIAGIQVMGATGVSMAGLTTHAPDWLGEVESEIDAILEVYLNTKLPGQQPEDFPDWGGVATYNDVPERTKAEVIEVFKQVAKDLRNATNE
jgi:hypothetical protein